MKSAITRSFRRPATAVVPLVVSAPVLLHSSLLAGVLWLAGLALLWNSPYWGPREKAVATFVTGLVPAAFLLKILAIMSAAAVGPVEVILFFATVVSPAGIAFHLLRAARHPN